jgi:hypothetical protein
LQAQPVPVNQEIMFDYGACFFYRLTIGLLNRKEKSHAIGWLGNGGDRIVHFKILMDWQMEVKKSLKCVKVDFPL